MKKAIVAVAAATTLLLGGCGDDIAPAAPVRDSEEYTGQPQLVANKRVDPEVMGIRTKSEQYCVTRKNGVCKSWGTRVKTEPYVADDKDWVLVLADGTEVDVEQYVFDRKKIGDMYP